MPRKPAGTNTRPTADWFAGATATVGAYAGSPVSSGVEVSLYNNAPAGQYLYLWWMTVHNDGDGPYQCFSRQGVEGSLLQDGAPIVAGNAQAFGQAYWQPVAANPPDYPTDTGIGFPMFFGDESGFNATYRSPGPIQILPAGWSFCVDNTQAGTAFGPTVLAITFYYSVLPFVPT